MWGSLRDGSRESERRSRESESAALELGLGLLLVVLLDQIAEEVGEIDDRVVLGRARDIDRVDRVLAVLVRSRLAEDHRDEAVVLILLTLLAAGEIERVDQLPQLAGVLVGEVRRAERLHVFLV